MVERAAPAEAPPEPRAPEAEAAAESCAAARPSRGAGGAVLMRWTVWTDGSGTTGGPAGIGYHAICNELSGTVEGSLPLTNATNQKAEILAAAFALHELPEGSQVAVVSDSKYLVKNWNEYLPGWRARGWRTRSGGTPKNVAHWQRLERAVARHESVTFEWTRGHAGTEGNERADVLAGEARRQAWKIIAWTVETPDVEPEQTETTETVEESAETPKSKKSKKPPAWWKSLPDAKMAEHLLAHTTIPDSTWTGEPPFQGREARRLHPSHPAP
jgi:ribonuclease HI